MVFVYGRGFLSIKGKVIFVEDVVRVVVYKKVINYIGKLFIIGKS